MDETELHLLFSSIAECGIQSEELIKFYKNDKNWLLPLTYLFKERGINCSSFKMAAKVFNIESQEQFVEIVNKLYKEIQQLKTLADSLPPQRFWE